MTQLADCKLHDQRKILDEQLDFQTPIGVSSATFVSEDDFKNTNEVKFEKKVYYIVGFWLIIDQISKNLF